MSQVKARLQSIKPEHRILWAAKENATKPPNAAGLMTFFVRYARKHPRDLPWRSESANAFGLLVAEMLLAQTKADDVAQIWPTLIRRYPSAAQLAQARTRSLVRLLQSLGLQNQKARALQMMSKAVVDRYAGFVPLSVPDLLSLPYVGLYVSCAVACFSYGQRFPIVDANVLRVLGRITGAESGRELRRSVSIWEVAWGILPRSNQQLHNYGILDFATNVCKARKPSCGTCELSLSCEYYRTRVSAPGSQL